MKIKNDTTNIGNSCTTTQKPLNTQPLKNLPSNQRLLLICNLPNIDEQKSPKTTAYCKAMNKNQRTLNRLPI